MKRKKSQKRNAKSRKKHASDSNAVQLQELITKQQKKYVDVDITLVNFKSPRRNVKPPKKYADEDFIYYNNAGSQEEFGIDPAFLCECALDTSDPSISEEKLNSSESTVTASENGDSIADISRLCDTVLITSDPADASKDNNQCRNDNNVTLVESEDDFIDLSKMCQTQLITSDPSDPQSYINRSGAAGNSEEEFILGLSDGELDFFSPMRHNQPEVVQKECDKQIRPSSKRKTEKKSNTRVSKRRHNKPEPVQKKHDEQIDPLLIQKTENNQNTTMPKRKVQRRKTRPKRRRKKKKNTKEKLQVQENGTDIPTNPEIVNVNRPEQDNKKVCPENTLDKEVPVLNTEVNVLNPKEGHISSLNIYHEDVSVPKSKTDYCCQDKEKVCPENVQYLKIPVCQEKGVEGGDSEDIFDKKVSKANVHFDESRPEEENVSPENIIDKEVFLATPYVDSSRPEKEKVCTENIVNDEILEATSKGNIFKPDDENVCPDDSFEKELWVTKTNVDDSTLEEKIVCTENILENKSSVLNLEAKFQEDLITASDKEKICKMDNKPIQLVAEEKSMDECSGPDTDSGCDVDMEQVCEEDDHLNVGVPEEEDNPVVTQAVASHQVQQVPYFSETRIVKVLLHRLENTKLFSLYQLEDTAIFREWRENKQLPKSAVLDSLILQPANDDADKIISAETNAKKSKKSKRYRRNSWECRRPKFKFLKCTNCNKKFPNEIVMKKHQGSRTCVATVKCRICFAKFKCMDRFLEHEKSNCDTDRVFACNDCGKSYALKHLLEKHQNPVCRTKSKTCEICNMQFHSRKSLRDHMPKHETQPPPKSYLCEICGALSGSSETFKIHKAQHVENLKHICKVCDKEFKYSRSLRHHMKMHSKDGSQFTCAECGTSFPELNKLKIHLAVHGMITSLQKFECNICKKVFSRNKNLKLHLKTHSVKKEFVCLKCTIPFNTDSDLREHMMDCGVKLSIKIKEEENLSIKEEKPHKCHDCGKCFNQEHYLKQHSVVHQKTIICGVCRKKFKSNFHLSQHKLMVSCNVSSSNYCCRECGQEYLNFTLLKMHFIKAHVKPTVKCDKCGKEFADQRKLKYHSVTHREGYWTSCKYCGKVITQRSIKNHILFAHGSLNGLENITGDNITTEVKDNTTSDVKENITCEVNVNITSEDKGNIGCVVKIEPTIKVEEQPNLSNYSVTPTTHSWTSGNVKPKLSFQNQSEKNLLPCRFCGKILGSRRSLQKHVIHVHKSSNTNDSLSGSPFPKVEPPINKVEKKPNIKEENGVRSSTEVLFQENKPRVMNNIAKSNLTCSICERVLCSGSSLRRHMLIIHKITLNSAKKPAVPKMESLLNIDAASPVVPKIENLFYVNGPPRINLKNENFPQSVTQSNAVEPIQQPVSESVINQLPSNTEQQISIHIPSMPVSPEHNNPSFESFKSDLSTSPQTEQQVPETPLFISRLSQNEYQNSDISNSNILMSQLINAQNYKMYMPNTSFLNSQCQNIEESSSINNAIIYENSRTHELIVQPTQLQQSHYPLLESSSILTPMAYISNEVPTSNVYSPPITDTIPSKTSESMKIYQSNQYTNPEMIDNVQTATLLDDKHLDMINNINCTPPPVQTIDSDTLINIPIEESLTPKYENGPEHSGSTHTAPSITYNYFISPACIDLSETLTQESNMNTQSQLPLYYQNPEVPDINYKIIQQNVPVASSTNTSYVLHQYLNPKPTQTTSRAHHQSPGTSNTIIVLQPESPRTSNIIVAKAVSSSNQHIKKVETRRIDLYKAESVERRPNVICNLCKKYFYTKEDLNKHLIVHGLEVTSDCYRCTTCDHTFSLKYKYRAEEHLRIHTGEKPFPCSLCPLKFRTSGIRNKHALSHSKPTVPTTCSLCHVKLCSTFGLQRHMRTVHKILETDQSPVPFKKEPSENSFQEPELSSFEAEEQLPIVSDPVDYLPNLQQPYMSQVISDFRNNEEPTPPHSYSYSFEGSNTNHSDLALDLSDLRDDFVPDAMETVLKLEHW